MKKGHLASSPAQEQVDQLNDPILGLNDPGRERSTDII